MLAKRGPAVRIAIFGTGGMGRELADICRLRLATDPPLSEIVFVCDDPEGPVDGLEVLPPADLCPQDRIVFALGSSEDRRKLSQRLLQQPLATLIAQTAIVSPSATLGAGSVLCDYSVVNSRSRIGQHFQGNVFSQISHDCVIGDFVTFAPRVSCNGWVEIEDDVFVGAGAVIRNGSAQRRLKIGRGAVIGMGAVVTADVPPMTTVMGVSAKP